MHGKKSACWELAHSWIKKETEAGSTGWSQKNHSVLFSKVLGSPGTHLISIRDVTALKSASLSHQHLRRKWRQQTMWNRARSHYSYKSKCYHCLTAICPWLMKGKQIWNMGSLSALSSFICSWEKLYLRMLDFVFARVLFVCLVLLLVFEQSVLSSLKKCSASVVWAHP